MHYEVVTAQATAPGSAGAAASALTGDSLVVKNSKSAARIIYWGACQQAAGYQRVVFPSGHDTTRNIDEAVPGLSTTGAVDLFTIPQGILVPVMPQETLSVTIAGSATAGDVESAMMLIQYDDLPNVNGRYTDPDTVMKAMASGGKFTTIRQTLTSTAAGYSGSALITAGSDLLHANTDYAVVGIETSNDVCGVTLIGPDTANVKIACPGLSTRADVTSNFFARLSDLTGMPLIPVINSGNKANTYLGLIANENTGATIVSLNLVMLP